MKLDIKKGDFYLLNGPAKVKVDSGLLECIAAPVKKGENVTVPVGKKVPLLGVKASKVTIDAKKEQITKLENFKELSSEFSLKKFKSLFVKYPLLINVWIGIHVYSFFVISSTFSIKFWRWLITAIID